MFFLAAVVVLSLTKGELLSSSFITWDVPLLLVALLSS